MKETKNIKQKEEKKDLPYLLPLNVVVVSFHNTLTFEEEPFPKPEPA